MKLQLPTAVRIVSLCRIQYAFMCQNQFPTSFSLRRTSVPSSSSAACSRESPSAPPSVRNAGTNTVLSASNAATCSATSLQYGLYAHSSEGLRVRSPLRNAGSPFVWTTDTYRSA